MREYQAHVNARIDVRITTTANAGGDLQCVRMIEVT